MVKSNTARRQRKGFCGTHGVRRSLARCLVGCCVFLLRSFTPLCMAWLLYVCFEPPILSSTPTLRFFTFLAIIEVVFCFLCFLRAKQLDSLKPVVHWPACHRHPTLQRIVQFLQEAAEQSGCVDPHDGTKRLVQHCNTECPHAVLVGWHQGKEWEDLCKSDMDRWLSWALFSENHGNLSLTEKVWVDLSVSSCVERGRSGGKGKGEGL